MSDFIELYQQLILDHYKKPRNFHKMEAANRVADGHNPLCGDHFTVYLKLENGIVQDISFEGAGCAISTASASLMTEAIKGKTETEAEALFKKFHSLVATESSPDSSNMGKLTVMAGVRQFPVRVKCATLAWHALHAALANQVKNVTTE